LGWTARPSRRVASAATTSLTFMFVDVPEPVWKTSIGNWSAGGPAAARAGARAIRDVGVEAAELRVRARRRHLHERERAHDRRVHPDAADREVLDRALRLRAPQRVRGEAELA